MVALNICTLRDLFPPGVAVAELWDFDRAGNLFPSERPAVQRAVARRAREFAAGRHCARQALTQLGFPWGPIPRGTDRAPCWPQGAVGSIAHSEGYCAAVAGRRSQFLGLGLDAEHWQHVDASVWAVVAAARDRRHVDALPECERPRRRALVFSAKEAFFKAQYAVSGAWVDFHDASVEVLGPDRFDVLLISDVPGLGAAGARFGGRYGWRGPILLTGLSLDA